MFVAKNVNVRFLVVVGNGNSKVNEINKFHELVSLVV